MNNIKNQIALIKNDIAPEFQIKEDAKKSLSNLLLEETNLKEDNKNFSTKISKAEDLSGRFKKRRFSRSAVKNVHLLWSGVPNRMQQQIGRQWT